MLAKHIRGRHMVANPEERAILNNLATGRVTIPPGPCPMPGCRMLVLHVAKHLKSHHDISRRRKEEELGSLKRATAIAALATSLDLEDPGEGSSTSQRQTCPNPSCIKYVEGLEKKLKQLQRRNAALRRKLQAYGEPELSTSSDEVEEVEPALPQQQQPQPAEEQQQQPQPSSSEEEDEQKQQQPPEPATPQQLEQPSSARRTLPFTARPPQPSSSSSSSSSEEDKPAWPQQSAKRRLSPGTAAEPPRKKVAGMKAPKEESEEDDTKPKLGKVARKVHRALAPYFAGKSRGSKIRNIVLGSSLGACRGVWTVHFLPRGDIEDAGERCIKDQPGEVLRKVGLAPTTIILYVGQAISFVEYFRATPPKHSRITGGQLVVVIRELRKLLKDLNRTVLGHQALIKQAKGQKLVPREGPGQVPGVGPGQNAISAGGHREGAPTRPKDPLQVLRVMEHKTVRKFGTAQIYLEAEDADTQDRFYALHKNLKRAKKMRELFVCLAIKDQDQAPAAAAAAGAAAAAATEQPKEESKGTPRKMLAALSLMAKNVKRKVGLSPSKPKRRPVVLLKKL
ncbi:hypothetical protein D5F01_LYC23772 [Larimichthys crocea]|uniref:Uncharacterized protein n=1 Tax=Larimichthys crocea TaxID=215358 RepID=A0A6G0HGI1_LARCR|nr:hypothetical protein D5F01_LYC23772 [Larimichthys crocea]